MSDDEIVIAIAEVCGWTHLHFRTGKAKSRSLVGFKEGYTFKMPRHVPRYLIDLNAMHEAEKVFDEMDYQVKNKYSATIESILESVVLKDDPGCIPDCCGYEQIHATARIRAEAFLRVLGKWTDP